MSNTESPKSFRGVQLFKCGDCGTVGEHCANGRILDAVDEPFECCSCDGAVREPWSCDSCGSVTCLECAEVEIIDCDGCARPGCEQCRAECRLGRNCRCGAVVLCELPADYVTFDVAIGEVIYLGVAMHGSGGILRERDPRRALARAKFYIDDAHRTFDLRFYTSMDRDGGTSLYASPGQVRLLAVHIDQERVRI